MKLKEVKKKCARKYKNQMLILEGSLKGEMKGDELVSGRKRMRRQDVEIRKFFDKTKEQLTYVFLFPLRYNND